VLNRSALGLVVALHVGSGAEARARVHRHIRDLATTEPNIAQVSRLLIVDDEFTRANGLLTSTMKLNRKAVEEQYGEALEAAPRVGG
jgi:long-subunit acyl-CoA synthetase (AMP-forming)